MLLGQRDDDMNSGFLARSLTKQAICKTSFLWCEESRLLQCASWHHPHLEGSYGIHVPCNHFGYKQNRSMKVQKFVKQGPIEQMLLEFTVSFSSRLNSYTSHGLR
jgi:hypothetical protein